MKLDHNCVGVHNFNNFSIELLVFGTQLQKHQLLTEQEIIVKTILLVVPRKRSPSICVAFSLLLLSRRREASLRLRSPLRSTNRRNGQNHRATRAQRCFRSDKKNNSSLFQVF